MPLVSGTPFLCHCICRSQFRALSRNKNLSISSCLSSINFWSPGRVFDIYWNHHRTSRSMSLDGMVSTLERQCWGDWCYRSNTIIIVVGDRKTVLWPCTERGVVFDPHLNMKATVKQIIMLLITSASVYAEPGTRPGHTGCCRAVHHAFLMNCLDFCNALLYGFQPDISAAAYTELHSSRWPGLFLSSERITPLLYLHWLPIQQIICKVGVLTYHALGDLTPAYLWELVEPYRPPRNLGFTNRNTFIYLWRYKANGNLLGVVWLYQYLDWNWLATTDFAMFHLGPTTPFGSISGSRVPQYL